MHREGLKAHHVSHIGPSGIGSKHRYFRESIYGLAQSAKYGAEGARTTLDFNEECRVGGTGAIDRGIGKGVKSCLREQYEVGIDLRLSPRFSIVN